MAADVTDGTVYIQDILPQNLKDLLAGPQCDIDKLLLRQIKVVSNCKKKLVQKRMDLLAAIATECSNNNYNSCGPFDGEFLNSVLVDVQKDEADARRKVLGEQESVEMFKSALASDLVSEDYLSVARSYRDARTKQLREVVEAREVLLIALEVLRRSPIALCAQHNAELENLGLMYSEVKEMYENETATLKKLTEFKKNPEMHITNDDEFFTFFGEENLMECDGEQRAAQPVDEKSNLASALETCKAEMQKLVNFKSTKVDSVDREFNMLAELASDILKHDATIEEAVLFVHKRCDCSSALGKVEVERYLAYLRMKYPKFKLKISTKGYNFRLKVMRKTKSVVSLSLLSTLLETSPDLPEEILEAQEKFCQLSNAVKRICSLYGRCSMGLQTALKKEDELKMQIDDTPKVDYAESLRISDNFTANMKELERLKDVVDEVKQRADKILQEVVKIAT